MFEERNTVNGYQITKNQKQNSNNKLKGYFENSTFLAQQEELATFIKNLPIIKMDDIKSINKLIEVLIKQNQMIGNRCQQNFITIKQCYAKHDDILKKNRNLQSQLIEAKKAFQRSTMNNKQIQSYQQQIRKLSTTIRQREQNVMKKEDAISKIQQQLHQAKVKNQFYYEAIQHLAQTIKIVSERNFKRGLEKVKEIHKHSKEKQMEWIDWDELEAYFKEEKKKMKYLPKIKETVQIFCSRFLKISEYVPIANVKDEFNKEVLCLMDILDDLLLLKRKNNATSQSRLTMSGAEYSFFEGLLDKVLKVHENEAITKQDLVNQLQEVKEQLEQSKKQYEEYLIKVKMQYEEALRRAEEQVEQKDQILQFYEEEKEKIMKDMIELKNKVAQFQQTLKAQRHLNKAKNEDFQKLQSELQSAKSQFATKEKQIREQWSQNIRTFQYKLSQKQQLVEQQQKLRKSLKQQLQQATSQFKGKNEENQELIRTLTQQLKDLTAKNKHLTDSLQTFSRKSTDDKSILEKELFDMAHRCDQFSRRIQKDTLNIKTLQEELEEGERQRNLQMAFIKQIQQKNNGLLTKIKALQSKKSEEKTAKKQMNAIKQTIVEQKKISKQIYDNFTSQKQQNQRLKGIIKQMKKQLQEVYLQFNHLKMIEGDRQKLIVQIQKSDRIKEQLCKEYQTMKIQLIKLDQQNKSLMIEARHYKNALLRIQALR